MEKFSTPKYEFQFELVSNCYGVAVGQPVLMTDVRLGFRDSDLQNLIDRFNFMQVRWLDTDIFNLVALAGDFNTSFLTEGKAEINLTNDDYYFKMTASIKNIQENKE